MDKKQKKVLVDKVLHEEFLVGRLSHAREFLDVIPDDLVDDEEEIESGYQYTEEVQKCIKQLDWLILVRLAKMQKFVDELIEDE